jgi:3-oxoacyl-[acyl-carrier-protein] synthase-1
MSAYVSALGARSPAGLDAEQTAFGILLSHLSPVRTRFENAYREAVGMSLLSALPDELEGKDRMVALAAPALAECLAADRRANPPTSQAKPIVLLGCPSPRPGFAATDAGKVLEAVVREARIDADPERSAAFAVGHAAFAVALERALQELPAARGAPLLVGCVDSYHDAEAIAHFDAEMRILSVRTPDAFLPAEGAAFVAVRPSAPGGTAPSSTPNRPVDGRAPGAPDAPGSFGEIVLAGTDLERTVTEGKPNLARAATDLVARAAQALGGGRDPRSLGWYLRTTNREHHRAREARFVMTRFSHLLDPDESHIDELAEHLGDAGAATGALLAVFVCQGFASGYAPQRTAVISLSSDGPERGIVALRRPPD